MTSRPKGRPAQPLTKEKILEAMAHTRSNRAASRYCNSSYTRYKRWAKLYESKTHENLFEEHKNQSGIGIPKFLKGTGKEPALIDLIEGRVDISSFSPEKIKFRLISEGYLEEKCTNCGFTERRVLDYKVPLILRFKDNNKKNYRPENTEMLCYNCYFLYYGDIFSKADLEQLESSIPLNNTTDAIDFELDEYHLERLKKLGLGDDKDEDDDLISYI